MTQTVDLVMAIQREFPELDIDSQHLLINDTVLTIPADHLAAVTQRLVQDFGFYHLSTITGLDNGSEIELLYHFWHGVGVTLRLKLSYDALEVVTLTNLIPGALFYEKEISEMLGIAVVGLANNAPLFLPDDWDGNPPLRKEEQ